MSKPGTIYRINWQAFHETEDIQGFIDISDNDNLVGDSDPVQVIDLQGSATPASLSVIDNNEDPFTVILAQQLTAQFESTNSVSMSTFASGSDQRWGVHYYIGTDTNTVFRGFLVMGFMSEALLPAPNTVTLTATDGIGLLRNTPLVGFDDLNPSGHYTVIDYLAMCMRQTGLSLEFRVAFNIKLDGMISDLRTPNTDDEHLFNNIFLEALSAEDQIGTSINCYRVIECILGEEAVLFQMKGQWWILRRDEVEDATRGLYVTSFDSNGDFIGNLGEFDFRKEIGKVKAIKFSQEASIVSVSQPLGAVKLTYNYNTPREIPCNVDFSRGAVIDDILPEKTYALDCWTLREGVPGFYGTVDGTTAIIHRLFNTNDQESDRYVVLTPRTSFENSSINAATYIESQAIYIDERDKFSTSINWRDNTDIATGGNGQARLFRVVLHGDDGSWWILGEDTIGDGIPKWFNTSAWTVNSAKGAVSVDFDEDDTEWRTITWDAPAAPVGGSVYLWANQFNQLSSADDTVEVWYQNLSFQYIPFIVYGYQKYSGQTHSTSQTGGYKAKREREVFMSDSPKKLFKWAMKTYNGSAYVLAEDFYNAAVFPDGPPSSDYVHTYGEIQLFDVWNQFKNEMREIQGTMQGADLDLQDTDGLPDIAHLINKWNPVDSSENLTNKYFHLLSFNQNHDNQEWTGTMREAVDLTKTKDYSNHEFEYNE